MKVIKMISYEEAKNFDEAIGGLGGFFSNGMRWGDYLEQYTEKGKKYAEALKSYIVEQNIKHGGDWHQNNEEGVPLFEDGKVALFSYRAWGDIMAAIWSEAENIDYNYVDFYMDYTMRS